MQRGLNKVRIVRYTMTHTSRLITCSPKQDDAVSSLLQIFPSGKFEEESPEVVLVYGNIRKLTLTRSSLILKMLWTSVCRFV